MICAGTGAAPFRGFTERRRLAQQGRGQPHLFSGTRTPEELPCFGPLQKVPATLFDQRRCFSRLPEKPREYVEHRMRAEAPAFAVLLRKPSTHIYVCGLRRLEAGVEEALGAIGREHGIDWPSLRGQMREQGRYHLETY
jgi:benzoyl-CoA 2,3-dioxygenase component A